MEQTDKTWTSTYCYKHGYEAASEKYKPSITEVASHGVDIAFCKYTGDQEHYEKGYTNGYMDTNFSGFMKKLWFLYFL